MLPKKFVAAITFLMLLLGFTACVSAENKDAVNNYQKGVKALDKLKFSDAEKKFEQAVQIDPYFVDAWYNLGYVKNLTESMLDHTDNINGFVISKVKAADKIGKRFVSLEKIFQDQTEDYIEKIRDRTIKEGYKSAVDSLIKAVDLDPKNAEAWNNLGFAYVGLENYREALNCFTQANSISKSANFYNNLGMTYAKLGDYEKATECLSNAVKLEPREAYFWNNRAFIFYQQKNYEAAHNAIDRAVNAELGFELLTKNRNIIIAKIDYLRGIEYMNRNTMSIEAENYFKSAVERNPNLLEAWYDFGYVCNISHKLLIGNNGFIISDCKDVTNSQFKERYARRSRAIEITDFEEPILYQYRQNGAIQSFKKIVEFEPQNAWAWNNLGFAYKSVGNYPDALKCFKLAIETDSTDADFHNNLGLTYERLGDYDNAVKSLTRAVELAPQEYYFWNNLAFVYYRQKNYSAALKTIDGALEIQVDSDFLNKNRDKILAKLSNS